MRSRNLKKSVWNITPTKRRAILYFLEKVENAQPKTTYYIDIFNTGIKLNSTEVKNKIVRFLKEIV